MSPTVQPWLYMQWGAPADFSTWESRMHTYIAEMKTRLDWLAVHHPEQKYKVVPGGVALMRLKQEIEAGRVPGMNDFFLELMADIHLTPKGDYFIALVFFSSFYATSPEGRTVGVGTGLNAEQNAIFQRIAWESVQLYKQSGVTPVEAYDLWRAEQFGNARYDLKADADESFSENGSNLATFMTDATGAAEGSAVLTNYKLSNNVVAEETFQLNVTDGTPNLHFSCPGDDWKVQGVRIALAP